MDIRHTRLPPWFGSHVKLYFSTACDQHVQYHSAVASKMKISPYVLNHSFTTDRSETVLRDRWHKTDNWDAYSRLSTD